MSNSASRYLGSLALAVGATLAAFSTMHLLVEHEGGAVAPSAPVETVRFDRIDIVPKIDPEPPFVKPERLEPEPLPPLPTPMAHLPIEPPPMEPPRVLKGKAGPGLLVGPPLGPRGRETTGDVACRARIAPQYPREMAMRGIEGRVTVAFTITVAGTVKDVQVIGSNPRGAFDDAARRAVARWTCEPRMVNGAAVEHRVTQTIDFNLDES